MAEKKEFELEIKSNIDKVINNVEKLSDSLEDVKDSQDKVTKSIEETEKATKSLAGGFKNMGLALKAAGIGIAIEAFGQFKDVLVSNQGVADKLNVSLGATKKVFGDLINTATSLDKLKAVFASIGSGNFFQDAKNYLGNVINASEKQVELTKAVKLAIVEQQGLVEQGDARAERLRQTRDNENLSLQERIQANKELGVALEEQAAAMKKLGDKQKELADLNYVITKNVENEVAQKEAINNLNAIDAQITGLKSEQIINEISLLKERRALATETVKTEIDLENSRLQTNNSVIKSEGERLADEKSNLEISLRDWAKFYEDQIRLNKKGSSGRVAIENEAKAKLGEIRNSIALNADATATYQYNRDQELRMEVVNNELEAYSSRLFALQQFNKAAQESTQVSEDEKRKIAKDTLVQQKIIENQRIAMVSNTLGNISSLFEASSTEGKAFAIAQSLVNTYQGITAELATKTATPFEFGLKVANVATVAAMGFKAVQDIINTQPSTSGGGMDMSGATPASAAPQFNVVGASGINQVAQTIGRQANQPVKAYVVSKDVTTAQSLDRNIVNAASM